MMINALASGGLERAALFLDPCRLRRPACRDPVVRAEQPIPEAITAMVPLDRDPMHAFHVLAERLEQCHGPAGLALKALDAIGDDGKIAGPVAAPLVDRAREGVLVHVELDERFVHLAQFVTVHRDRL